MKNLPLWIEHLSKPLVLAGFVLFVLAGLIWFFKPEKLNGKATERLLDKFMTLMFVLGSLTVLSAFAISYVQAPHSQSPITPPPLQPPAVPPPTSRSPVAPLPTITQSISNSQGTAVQAGRDANVGSGTHSNQIPPPGQPPANLKQQIDGSTGIQVQSGRDANIQAPEK